MRTAYTTFALLLTCIGLSFNANAQSAKATAKVGNIAIVDSEAMGWTTVLSNNIKTPNAKDLFVSASLECGLYSQTEVKSKGGKKDTSSAEASVKVRVLIDGKRLADPGEITYCRRMQELSAEFGGVLDTCTDLNGDGTISSDECEFTDESLNLVLETMDANSFNFIAADLTSGYHKIEVQAKIDSETSSQNGSSSAKATIGHGAVTVEEVRMIRGEDFEL